MIIHKNAMGQQGEIKIRNKRKKQQPTTSETKNKLEKSRQSLLHGMQGPRLLRLQRLKGNQE